MTSDMPEVERCPVCGNPLVNDACAECEQSRLAGLIQREAIVLASLVAITVVTFLLTRSAAAHDRAAAERAAATWFETATRAMARGDREDAISSLRQAALNAPHSVRYQLPLADALAADNRLDEAERILRRLRESAPESGEINLALARVAATRDDVPETTRYYHHALYGIWGSARVIEPVRERALRTELIRFLLDHQRRREALSEILVLAQELPNEARAHVETGKLFLAAESPSNALVHFADALAINPADPPALAGAAEAAFAVRDYVRAGQFLTRLRKTGETTKAAGFAPVLDAILTGDPLAPRLSSTERARRLTAAMDRAIARASSCESSQPGELPALLGKARALRVSLLPERIGRDRELADTSFNVAVRIEHLSQNCGDSAPIDRALLLLGEKYADTLP